MTLDTGRAIFSWQSLSLLVVLSLVVLLQFLNPQIETKEIERIVTKEVVQTEYKDRIVYRDREKTKTITKPDGTKIVIETRDKTSSTTKEASTTTEKLTEVSKERIVYSKLSRYSIKIALPILPLGYYNIPSEYLIGGGIRLGNLPVFMEIDTRPFKKELYLGVRIEF